MSLKKWVILFIVVFCSRSFSQGESAIGFLLVPGSPKLNGAGSAGTATLTDDPYKLYFNPAHLGFSSKSENISSGFYPGKMQWLPYFFYDRSVNNSGISINNYVFTAGYNLKKLFPNLPLSIGFGYSRSEFNYFNNYDFFSAYSFGIGYSSIINLSAGITLKDIKSKMTSYVFPDGLKSFTVNTTAYDYGLLINIPLNNFLSQPVSFGVSNHSRLNMNVDYTLGYAIQNVGDKVHYVDYAQSDPIGRTARLAHNLQLGFNFQSDVISIEVLNLSYSIDAEDLLIKMIAENGSNGDIVSYHPEYQGVFSGDIKPLKNLFLGKGDPQIVLHKGLIAEFFETVTISSGGLDGRGFSNRKTSGFGIRSRGMLKAVNILLKNETIDYIIKHFDIQYISSKYFKDSPFESKFSGLTIAVKGF